MRALLLMVATAAFVAVSILPSHAVCNDPGVIYHKWVTLQGDLLVMHKAFITQSPDVSAIASRLLARWQPIGQQFPACEDDEELSAYFGGVIKESIGCFRALVDKPDLVPAGAKYLNMMQRVFYEEAWPGSSKKPLPALYCRSWFNSASVLDQPPPKSWTKFDIMKYVPDVESSDEPIDDTDHSILRRLAGDLRKVAIEYEARLKSSKPVDFGHYLRACAGLYVQVKTLTGEDALKDLALQAIQVRFDAISHTMQTKETNVPEAIQASALALQLSAELFL